MGFRQTITQEVSSRPGDSWSVDASLTVSWEDPKSFAQLAVTAHDRQDRYS